MIYEGVRRCDLCSSEILGRRGMDVCYLCRLMINGDSDVVDDEEVTLAPNVLVFPRHRKNQPPIVRGE